MRILIAAFLGLVLSSRGYAVLAGEPGDAQPPSASAEPVPGVGFAITGSMVIYAIVLTLDAAERLVPTPSQAHRLVSASARHILATFVTPLQVTDGLVTRWSLSRMLSAPRIDGRADNRLLPVARAGDAVPAAISNDPVTWQ